METNEVYDRGMKDAIQLRAAFCDAAIEKFGSCENCIMRKYNKSGLPCKAFMTLEPDVVVKLLESRIDDTDKVSSDYMTGFKHGIQLVSACCALNDAECERCPLIKEDADCLDIMKENPDVILNRLYDMLDTNGGITYSVGLVTNSPVSTVKSIYRPDTGLLRSYYDEFVTRFPESTEEVGDLANTVCRASCFGVGYDTCEGYSEENCLRCWLSPYNG